MSVLWAAPEASDPRPYVLHHFVLKYVCTQEIVLAQRIKPSDAAVGGRGWLVERVEIPLSGKHEPFIAL